MYPKIILTPEISMKEKRLQQIIDIYVKKDIRDSVFYWRTKDRKEIDFILRIKNKLLPIEVKLNFEQFNPSEIPYFNKHYGIDNYRVVALNGTPKSRLYIYPWAV